METGYRSKATGEPMGEAIRVPSFTDPNRSYSVDLAVASCECPRYVHRGNCVKHVVLAEAIAKSRSRKYRFEREASESCVTDLCKSIFAPKLETASEAYSLFCQVVGCRYSTARMVEAARRRHRKAYTVEIARVVA